jgi:hypothetical protein
MDCCSGDIPINFGTWYSQLGKTPEECTYCEYCFNNKCIDISQLYKINDLSQHCVCDCPKKNMHPKLLCYLCPKCEIERFGSSPSQSNGTCKKCKFRTPFATHAYCASCSIQFKSCYECGLPIKNGNTYITEVETVIQKHIQEIKRLISINKSHEQQYLQTIKMLTTQLQEARQLFANKTPEQMCRTIIDYQKKRYSKMPSS